MDGRVLQFANYTFDVSVWVSSLFVLFRRMRIFCLQDWGVTLIDGGTLCIVPKQQLMEDLANVADSLDITFMHLTPTGELSMCLARALMIDIHCSRCAYRTQ
jgi:hypothetical protein